MTSYKHNFLTNSVHVQYELHILGKKEKTEREGRREGKREQKGGRKKMSILFGSNKINMTWK